MSVFEHHEFDDHEQVLFCKDKASGLQAIIAVHNTTLGPSLGGCRMWQYANSAEALNDVLRLSKGMTYKAAMADLKLGGGKSVIIGNPYKDKSDDMMAAMGRFINAAQGDYISAEDSGISISDLNTWPNIQIIFLVSTHDIVFTVDLRMAIRLLQLPMAYSLD